MAGAAAFQAGFFRRQGEPRSRSRFAFGWRSDPRRGDLANQGQRRLPARDVEPRARPTFLD
jgi:hypothetical protein